MLEMYFFCCARYALPFSTLFLSSSFVLFACNSFFFFLRIRPPPNSPLFPYPTLFRSRSCPPAAPGPGGIQQARDGPLSAARAHPRGHGAIRRRVPRIHPALGLQAPHSRGLLPLHGGQIGRAHV